MGQFFVVKYMFVVERREKNRENEIGNAYLIKIKLNNTLIWDIDINWVR